MPPERIDCPSGKIRYPNIAWARRCAHLLGCERQRAYWCPECGGAHLTRANFAHRAYMAERLICEQEMGD